MATAPFIASVSPDVPIACRLTVAFVVVYVAALLYQVFTKQYLIKQAKRNGTRFDRYTSLAMRSPDRLVANLIEWSLVFLPFPRSCCFSSQNNSFAMNTIETTNHESLDFMPLSQPNNKISCMDSSPRTLDEQPCSPDSPLQLVILSSCSRTCCIHASSKQCDKQQRGTNQYFKLFHHSNPFQLPEKQAWHHQCFGHLDHTHLGSLEAIPESALHWPLDCQMTFMSCKGHALTYKIVNAKLEADRVAEIFQAAIDEQEGNSEYEWHHSAQAIRDKVATGKYSIWGTYDRTDHNKLIAANSCEFLPGQRAVHWIWGAVDPACRGRGVWENVGIFMDKMIEKTGAQEGIVWMATTHNLSQRMIEKVPGWRPVGFYPGGELLGGSDGLFYRQNVVWYSKLFNDAELVTQSPEDAVLTEAAEHLAKAVLEYNEPTSAGMT